MIIAIDGTQRPASPRSRGRRPRAGLLLPRHGRDVPRRRLAGVAGRGSFDDDEALGRLARAHDIAFAHEEGEPVPRRVSIGGIDVTDAIRTAEIDRAVSPMSAAPSVARGAR